MINFEIANYILQMLVSTLLIIYVFKYKGILLKYKTLSDWMESQRTRILRKIEKFLDIWDENKDIESSLNKLLIKYISINWLLRIKKEDVIKITYEAVQQAKEFEKQIKDCKDAIKDCKEVINQNKKHINSLYTRIAYRDKVIQKNWYKMKNKKPKNYW